MIPTNGTLEIRECPGANLTIPGDDEEPEADWVFHYRYFLSFGAPVEEEQARIVGDTLVRRALGDSFTIVGITIEAALENDDGVWDGTHWWGWVMLPNEGIPEVRP